jgi:hypothetical protein
MDRRISQRWDTWPRRSPMQLSQLIQSPSSMLPLVWVPTRLRHNYAEYISCHSKRLQTWLTPRLPSSPLFGEGHVPANSKYIMSTSRRFNEANSNPLDSGSFDWIQPFCWPQIFCWSQVLWTLACLFWFSLPQLLALTWQSGRKLEHEKVCREDREVTAKEKLTIKLRWVIRHVIYPAIEVDSKQGWPLA